MKQGRAKTRFWMRILWIAGCLMVGWSMSGYAEDPVLTNFSRANEYFQQKKYDSALQLYKACIDKGIVSPDVYYNAGCAAFESRHMGEAVYYFRKALLLAQEKGLPTADIEHNLHVAEQQVKDMPETLPPLFFISAWYRLVHMFSLNTWALLIVVNIWIMALLLAMRWLRGQHQSGVKYIFGASIYSLLLLIVITLSAYQSTHPHRAAVCIAPQAALHTAPDSQSEVMTQLSGGVPCEVLDMAGSWCKIQLPNHISGWVKAEAIRQL